MTENFPLHVVDSDCSRRASIAHEFSSSSFHIEIYENIRELIDRLPKTGAILIADGGRSDCEGWMDTIRSSNGYLPVAYFAEAPSPRMIVRAILSGALDYLEWPFSSDALEATVKRLQQQSDKHGIVERRRAGARQLVQTLTRRELNVLEGLVAGESNKENALRLGISPRTVESHRGNVMASLHARSVSDVVRIGLDAGLY